MTRLRLHANENSVIPRKFISNLLKEAVKKVDPRFYPEKYSESLCEKIAEKYNLTPENILVGNGADKIIDIITRATITPEMKAVIIEPTFSMYRYSVESSFGSVKQFILTPPPRFALPMSEILSRIDEKDGLLFICSPNNPTGNQFKKANILEIAKKFPGIVAVDETYSPFSDSSLVKEINRISNLVIIKSFSKAYGLAGMRIGYAISNSQVMKKLRPYLPIYNLNSLSLELAKMIFDHQAFFDQKIELIKQQREKVFSVLQTMKGITPYPSNANFILFRSNKINALTLYQSLVNREITVRKLAKYVYCENSLRFTITSPRNNRLFIDTLQEIIDAES